MKLLYAFQRDDEPDSWSEPLTLQDEQGSSVVHLLTKRSGPRDYMRGFGSLFRFRRRPKGPPPPPDLDENGLPREWRNDLAEDTGSRWLLERSNEHWPIFEKWCDAHSRTAFPATSETVLGFVLDPPVRGRELYDAWSSIRNRHEAIYWHEDACPYCGLTRGYRVYVRSDGSVEIPDGVLDQFDLSFLEVDPYSPLEAP